MNMFWREQAETTPVKKAKATGKREKETKE